MTATQKKAQATHKATTSRSTEYLDAVANAATVSEFETSTATVDVACEPDVIATARAFKVSARFVARHVVSLRKHAVVGLQRVPRSA